VARSGCANSEPSADSLHGGSASRACACMMAAPCLLAASSSKVQGPMGRKMQRQGPGVKDLGVHKKIVCVLNCLRTWPPSIMRGGIQTRLRAPTPALRMQPAGEGERGRLQPMLHRLTKRAIICTVKWPTVGGIHSGCHCEPWRAASSPGRWGSHALVMARAHVFTVAPPPEKGRSPGAPSPVRHARPQSS
jgi:hypothetical protein